MVKNRVWFGAIALGLIIVWGSCVEGALPTAKVKVGDKMADFTLPEAAGGKPHSLYEFGGKKAVVVIFIATQCPYSNAFNHVMESLSTEYASRGVTVVGINANKTEPATQVAEHARTHGMDFTILKDEGNVIADRLGARVTPEVYLLDSSWVLRYHGALGNSHNPSTKPDVASDAEVRPALEAVLAGRGVAQTETKAFGCTIKRV